MEKPTPNYMAGIFYAFNGCQVQKSYEKNLVVVTGLHQS